MEKMYLSLLFMHDSYLILVGQSYKPLSVAIDNQIHSINYIRRGVTFNLHAMQPVHILAPISLCRISVSILLCLTIFSFLSAPLFYRKSMLISGFILHPYLQRNYYKIITINIKLIQLSSSESTFDYVFQLSPVLFVLFVFSVFCVFCVFFVLFVLLVFPCFACLTSFELSFIIFAIEMLSLDIVGEDSKTDLAVFPNFLSLY